MMIRLCSFAWLVAASTTLGVLNAPLQAADASATPSANAVATTPVAAPAVTPTITSPTTASEAETPLTLEAIIKQVGVRYQAGTRTEADFAPEIAALDKVIAGFADKDPDGAIRVLVAKAQFYLEVVENRDRALALLKEAQTRFPTTRLAQEIPNMVKQVTRQMDAAAAQAKLVVGATFPDFDVKDTEGRPLSLAALRGKVVVVDFWATWCGPCVAEVPRMVELRRRYENQPVAFIGVSLDQELEALKSFVKARGIDWPQYFDGGGWENALAVKYGINHVPSLYILDPEGRILAADARVDDLEQLLAKRFPKP